MMLVYVYTDSQVSWQKLCNEPADILVKTLILHFTLLFNLNLVLIITMTTLLIA